MSESAAAKEARERKETEIRLRSLLDSKLSDQEFRPALEKLAGEWAFQSLSPLWGPALYRRNRVVYRPFILARMERFAFHRVPREVAPDLERWLAEVERDGDQELFRQLYPMKLDSLRGAEIWRADLLQRFRAAQTPSERAAVLGRFDLWMRLDQTTAAALYAIDPETSRQFIIGHLESVAIGARPWWSELADKAKRDGDDRLYSAIYLQQAPSALWLADLERLAAEIRDPERLVAELGKLGVRGDSGPAFTALIKKRGRDVFPYVLPRLQMRRGWFTGKPAWFKELLALAQQKDWIDLSSALLRLPAAQDDFDRELARLIREPGLDPSDRERRLVALAEPGPGGWVRPLSDELAALILQQRRDLLSGLFKAHLAAGWRGPPVKLVEQAIAMKDATLIDQLAGRAVTINLEWMATRVPEWPKVIERLSAHYESLPGPELGLRAAAVLGAIPAFAIFNYDRLLIHNRLARLLFGKIDVHLIDLPGVVRDLLESPEIHVQALALRVLGRATPGAKQLAERQLDLLLPMLLRNLHRRTRLLAFAALDNAAIDLNSARLIDRKAREAMDLPDRRYPKEALIGLIGRLLHRYPELRSASEQPQVHRGAAL